MTIGSTRPMEDAARIAYRELIRWLVADYGWDKLEAYFFLTQAGRVRLGNMVDPKYTLGASVLKSYLGLIVDCVKVASQGRQAGGGGASRRAEVAGV